MIEGERISLHMIFYQVSLCLIIYILLEMKKAFLILLICCQGILLNISCGFGSLFEPDKRNALRAPSYPLISVDPYTSVWSFADELNTDATRHWTGKE